MTIIETELSNKELVAELKEAQGWLAYYTREVGKFEQMIAHRMEANNATVLINEATGEILVERKPKVSPEYDQGILRAIIEVAGFGDGAYEECWVKEYQKEPVTVPGHWDMVKVLKWGRKLGAQMQSILDRAQLPQRPGKLEFTDAN